MTDKILNLYKPQSLTPLQLINEWRKNHPEYKKIKLGFAGRLDPMAEGVMLVLVGEENKNKNKYLKLDKVYEFDVLFGISTDSFDTLGKIVKQTGSDKCKDLLKQQHLKAALKTFIGKQKQKYPPYSTKTVKGKSLFEWARSGKLNKIKIPEQIVEIYKIKLLKTYQVTAEKLKNFITKSVNNLKGDFRQKEVLKTWQDVLTNNNQRFLVTKIRVYCSTGTYVRSLANDLGKKLGCPALALNIVRISVGKHNIKNSLKIKKWPGSQNENPALR